MTSSRFVFTVALIFCVVVCGTFIMEVQSHGYLKSPEARSGGGDNLRKGPCGGDEYTKGNVVAQYEAGNGTIAVVWDIVANHGGVVAINLLDVQTTEDPSPHEINLVTGVDRMDEYFAWDIPKETYCSNCTLQWIWSPSSEGVPYFGCADIAITAFPTEDPISAAVLSTATLPTLAVTAIMFFVAKVLAL